MAPEMEVRGGGIGFLLLLLLHVAEFPLSFILQHPHFFVGKFYLQLFFAIILTCRPSSHYFVFFCDSNFCGMILLKIFPSFF